MTLPEIQERLLVIADELTQRLLFPRPLNDIAKDIRHLSNNISRRKAIRKAPVQSRSMTPEFSAEIAVFATTHPTWSMQRIAEHFNVTAGRVSEALRGKRK